jgi:hypothetical protein
MSPFPLPSLRILIEETLMALVSGLTWMMSQSPSHPSPADQISTVHIPGKTKEDAKAGVPVLPRITITNSACVAID